MLSVFLLYYLFNNHALLCAEMLPAWLEQLYMEQEQMVA